MSNPFKTGIVQNPSPTIEGGSEYNKKVQEEAQFIMQRFLKMLPSNYVSQKTGPFYTLQFKAMAEALARVQISLQQVGLDYSYENTRSELMWQILGSMVFPKVTENQLQPPIVEGDVSYREFLSRMVVLLLKGSTKLSVEEGAGLLADADVTLIEKSVASQLENSAWGFDDQFTFEVNVEKNGGTDFPHNPFDLHYNVRVILDALKPAHTLFEYRHVFREVFGYVFQDEMFLQQEMYYYDDFRKYCLGVKNLVGQGIVLSDRHYLSDPNRSFSNVQVGSTLYVQNKPYQVKEIRSILVGDETTPQYYTTSPTGLSGYATVVGDILTDDCQDWSLAIEGEILTFQQGINKEASYKLQDVLGANGGSIGFVSGGGTQVRVAPTILKLERRLPTLVSVQYQVTIDRLGVQEMNQVIGENLSTQCYL